MDTSAVSRRTFAAALGATMLAPSVARAQSLTAVRVATIPSDVGAEAFYAQAQGMFRRNGLDAEITPLTNGGAILAAVAGGSADFGMSNTVSVVTAHEKGLPLTIVAPAAYHLANKPTTGLVIVRANSGIAKAKDLNGKVVAVNGLRSISQIAVLAWVDANGGDSSTLKFVELPFPQMAPDVRAGKIDAASVNIYADTSAGKGENAEKIIGSAFDAIAPRFLSAVYVANNDFVAKHPDVVKRFAAAIRDAGTWANANQRASADILAGVTKESAADINGVTRASYADQLTPGLLQPIIDASAKYHVLTKPFPAAELLVTS